MLKIREQIFNKCLTLAIVAAFICKTLTDFECQRPGTRSTVDAGGWLAAEGRHWNGKTTGPTHILI